MRQPSLRGRLRWLIVMVLAAVLLPLGLFSFQRTINEVDELSDGRLAQGARTLDVLIGRGGMTSQRAGMLVPSSSDGPAGALHVRGHTYESEVGFQVFDGEGRLSLATANLAALPPPDPTAEGFRDVQVGRYRWRVYTLVDPDRNLMIRAGERYDSRHEIKRALWLDHGLPLLLGLPLLGLMVGWAVKRGLHPLAALAQALAARQPGSHEPIVLARAPLELQPMLDALNAQLGRLEDALERERRFSSDVAHELRTPLASSLINLENAMAHTDPAEAHAELDNVRNDLTGLARRIQQLLSLARLEAGAASDQRSAVDLIAVASDVIDELVPLIAGSSVDMGFARPQDVVVVQGYEAALAAMMRNLVENALRQVPGGGRVRLSIEQDAREVRIEVADDGPGIPAERRAAVFARFHREPGSRGDGYGLGLSIVQRAAQLHHASIELLDSPFGRGLRVKVAIPRS